MNTEARESVYCFAFLSSGADVVRSSVRGSSIPAAFEALDDVAVFAAEFFEFPDFQQRWRRARGFDRALNILHAVHDPVESGKQFDVVIGAVFQIVLPRV